MRFLCDVHIPVKLSKHLIQLGFESVHINQILDKWYTKDSDISLFADNFDYIVITKDIDFRDSFYLKNTPKKLIKINLGNISNADLLEIFSRIIKRIRLLNENSIFIVEVDKEFINYKIIDKQ